MESGIGNSFQGCRALGLNRSSYYYVPHLCERSRQICEQVVDKSRGHPRYGYRRITALMHRDGQEVSHKRVQRVRRNEGLQVSKKQKKMRRVGQSSSLRKQAEYANHVWSWDFFGDEVEGSNGSRMLTLIDEYTRQWLAVHAAWSIRAVDVIKVVEGAMEHYGVPEHIRSDNGPEFIAYCIEDWLKDNQIESMYIKPGSPWENAYIESYHDKLRDEHLNREIYCSLAEAKVLLESFRIEYNQQRIHSSLGYQTPSEFAADCRTALRAIPISIGTASNSRSIRKRTLTKSTELYS
ncbi:MAG: IS3 family transposase [Verrucomicrobiota bacterium]